MPTVRQLVHISAAQLAAGGGQQEIDYMLDRPPYTRYYWDGDSFASLGGSSGAAGFIMANDAQYGGTWDGTTADDTALQAAIDDAANYTPKKNVMLPPLVCLRTGVHVPANVHIYGYQYTKGRTPTTVKAHASASLTTGFMFNMATVDGVNPDAGSPQLGIDWKCGIFGVFMSNPPNLAGISLATFCDTFIAEDIHAYRHTQIFKSVPGQYIDNIHIARITGAASYDNSQWAIEITGTGSAGHDCMVIDELNFPVTNAYTVGEQALKISLGSNGRISNMINGSVYLYQVSDFEISKYHAEYGNIFLENCHNVKISEPFFKPHPGDTYYPIEIVAASGLFYGSYSAVIENYTRNYYLNADGPPADIRLHYSATVQTINCKVVCALSGTTPRPYRGITINDKDGNPITGWNNHSHYLSQNGYLAGGTTTSVPFGSHNLTVAADFTGVSGTIARTASGGTPTSALVNGNTYYYYAQYITDTTGAYGVNQSGAEISQTANAANQIFGMPLGYGSCSKHGLVKIYRGDSAGNYNKVAILNSMNSMYIFDTGGTCCGVAWTGRGAGPVDTVASGRGTFTVTPSSGLQAAPLPQTVAFSATLNVNFASGTIVTVGTLTGNITHASPTNIPLTGTPVRYQFTEDAGAAHTHTWSALHKGAWPTGVNEANQKKTIYGINDGTNLIFQSNSS